MHCNSAGSKLPVSTPLAERNSNPKVAKCLWGRATSPGLGIFTGCLPLLLSPSCGTWGPCGCTGAATAAPTKCWAGGGAKDEGLGLCGALRFGSPLFDVNMMSIYQLSSFRLLFLRLFVQTIFFFPLQTLKNLFLFSQCLQQMSKRGASISLSLSFSLVICVYIYLCVCVCVCVWVCVCVSVYVSVRVV